MHSAVSCQQKRDGEEGNDLPNPQHPANVVVVVVVFAAMTIVTQCNAMQCEQLSQS
jgi:hypothetical protein